MSGGSENGRESGHVRPRRSWPWGRIITGVIFSALLWALLAGLMLPNTQEGPLQWAFIILGPPLFSWLIVSQDWSAQRFEVDEGDDERP